MLGIPGRCSASQGDALTARDNHVLRVKMSTSNQPEMPLASPPRAISVTITSTAIASDLKTFVTTAFDWCKSDLVKFAPIAKSTLLSNVSKGEQASVYIRDVSKLIAYDYVTSNFGFVDDGSLNYNIAMLLLNDGRVQKALELTGDIWDGLCSLQQFADAGAFNFFSTTITARDELRAEMMFCCCF